MATCELGCCAPIMSCAYCAKGIDCIYNRRNVNMAICYLKESSCNYCVPGPCPHRGEEAGDEDAGVLK